MRRRFLSPESVQSASLAFKSVDDVQSSDSLSLSMFSISDSVSDDDFKENLQNTSSFLLDESRNTLDSTSTGQSTDGGFSNTLDVIAKDLSVTLGASFSKSFSSFTTS